MISDIDECAGEAHNCSSNAVCNNTRGSYNCTCKPGYEGDGNNCTGNFFRKFVFFADHALRFLFFSGVLYRNFLPHCRPYYLKIQGLKFITLLAHCILVFCLLTSKAGIGNFFFLYVFLLQPSCQC